MNKTGANGKPLAKHKLDGTYRKDRHGGSVESEPYKTAPRAPSYLGKLAKKEWRRITPLLVEHQLLTPMDVKTLEMYCYQFDIIHNCYEDVMKNGTNTPGYNGNLVKNPSWQTMKEAIELCNKIGAKFGFTPVDRMKVQVEKKPEESKIQSILEAVQMKKVN